MSTYIKDSSLREAINRAIDERVEALKNKIAVPLCEERQADFARGGIAELKKLRELINTTGEQ